MLKITAFLSGLLFGIGLLVSGMAKPSKVLNFLDLAGAWDPSLALVMVGAIAVGVVSFSLMKKHDKSILGEAVQLPKANKIDRRLVIGSAIFGIGWGIAGICPGPALVLLGTGMTEAFLFVAAMLAGMMLFQLFSR